MQAAQQQTARENGHEIAVPMPADHRDPTIDRHRDLFEADPEAEVLECRAGPVQGVPDQALIEGLCKARQEIEDVEKSGHNSHLSKDYATHEDVTRAVAEPLAEAGVWCFPSVVDSRRQRVGTTEGGSPRYRVTLVLETLWSAGGQAIRSYWIGETLDNGDKQHYQLLSQLTKYAIAKTLKLDSGEEDGRSTGGSASERQLSYIDALKKRCRKLGASEDEHEILRVTAQSKERASEQIEALQELEERLEG